MIVQFVVQVDHKPLKRFVSIFRGSNEALTFAITKEIELRDEICVLGPKKMLQFSSSEGEE